MSSAIILCVDDEKNNRDLLRAVLVPRGFEVLRATSATNAFSPSCRCSPTPAGPPGRTQGAHRA